MAKVLVIDDEASIATLVAEIVEGNGHEATIASNGQQGLNLLRTTEFQLVISDIMMPQLSGSELLRIVRADPKLNQLNFVLMSAVANLANLDHTVAADAFIVKPFDISVIDRLVTTFLDTPPSSPHILPAQFTSKAENYSRLKPSLRNI